MSLVLPCVSNTRGNPSHPYSSNFGSGLVGRCERKLMFMAAEFEVNSKYSMTSSNIISPFREMEFISAVLPVKNCETKYKLCQGGAEPDRPQRAHGRRSREHPRRAALGPGCQLAARPGLRIPKPSRPSARLGRAAAAGTGARRARRAPSARLG